MVTSAKRLENDCFLAEAMTKLDSVLKSQEIGSMHDTGCSGLVRWDDPEGWDGEGGGRGFRMGNTCAPMSDPCQSMAKTTTML